MMISDATIIAELILIRKILFPVLSEYAPSDGRISSNIAVAIEAAIPTHASLAPCSERMRG
jgi:hypothetical protein